MKAVVIPTSLNNKPYLIELGNNENEVFHRVIGCNCIDSICLSNDGRYSIECILDDEGLVKHTPLNQYWNLVCLYNKYNYKLAGTLIICMSDRLTGEIVELNLTKVKSFLINTFGLDSHYFDF